MAQKMLTVKEVAEALSVTEWVVRRWVSQGKVPGATKFGRTIRIPERFLEEGTAGAGDHPTVELDYDPRDTWPTVKPTEPVGSPEPIEPPADEEG